MSDEEAPPPHHPTVLVDMDGPLADFDGAFYELCRKQGWLMHRGHVSRITPCRRHRFLTDCLARGDRRMARHVIEQSRWFLDLPVTTGAVEGINRLAEHAEVWICTKPLEANATCRDDKAAWVRRHLGSPWEKRLIVAPDKSMVRGHVLLDDAPKTNWLARAVWNPVLFTTSWNRESEEWAGLPRWVWTDPIESLLEHASTTAAPTARVG